MIYVRNAVCNNVSKCNIFSISVLSHPSAMVFAIATASKLMSTSFSNIIQYIPKEKSWQFNWNLLTSSNPYRIIMTLCGHGGTGRRVRLRGVWGTVWVQVSLAAPTDKQKCLSFFCAVSRLVWCATPRATHKLTRPVSWRYTIRINSFVTLLRTPSVLQVHTGTHPTMISRNACLFL